MLRRKIKRAILITVITLMVIVAVIIACISPIAKYAIEKYDVKYLGREIKIGWLYLNPFTGYLHIGNLKVYEAHSDSLFLTADGLSANYQIFKTFRKTYEVSNISLNKPVGYIIQNKKLLNFSDIIELFKPKEKKDTTQPKKPVHFNILNISVTDGEFHYIEQNIPVHYFVKHVNVESTGKWWDVDSMKIKFELESGMGTGTIKGNGSINFDSVRYRVEASIKKFDLKPLEQYLRDLANYGSIAAILDADVKATGSFINGLDLDGSGFIAISDFHFGEKPGDDFASCDRIVINAVDINPKEYEYVLDSIMLGHPFFKYERYDHLDNIQNMFGKGGARVKQAKANSDAGQFNLIIEIAKYIQKLAKNFLQSYYAIDKVAIYNGDVLFNDFALREKFTVEANPLYLLADSLDKDYKRIHADFVTGIKPYGSIKANLSLDPNNYSNFGLHYSLAKVPVSMFNPYVVSYTSFPLDRGSLDFNGFINVRDSAITSENHLVIVDPRVAKRVKKKDTKWIPVPLIMALVRSTGNAVDFEVPIRGSLKDPKFKIWGAIGEVVKNIFVKPPSTAYLIHVKNVEQEVEKSLSLSWQMRQTELRPVQEKFVKKIAGFLKSNADASITVLPVIYTEKEKEHILLYEAKRKYFLQAHKMNSKDLLEEDSVEIEKMSVKDSGFVHYLDKLIGDTSVNTIQEKCALVISTQTVNNKFVQLIKNRQQVFKTYFDDAASRVKFNNEQSNVPFNGFSYYKIDYNGEVPKALLDAYQELLELNNESPRKKYKEKRKERADLKAAEHKTKE